MDTGVIEKGRGGVHRHGEGVVTDTGVIDTRGIREWTRGSQTHRM